MKSILLLLAAVSWAAANLTGDITPGLRPSREYWYEYDSQVLTGIRVLNLQYSGIKIKARVMLQKAQDEYVTMKVSNARVFKVKERAEDWRTAREEVRARGDESERMWDEGLDVPFQSGIPLEPLGDILPTGMVPDSLLEELPPEHSNIIVSKLVLPIKFRYERGIVTKVYADGGDPYWSINVKKGIISMMYLDLNAANKITDIDSTPVPSYIDVIRPDYTSMSDKTGFKVKEPSTIGNCETYYSIVPDVSLSELRVKKIPNIKKCTPKVVAEVGTLAGILPVPGIPEKEVVIQPSITSDYLLIGSRHEFTIKKALVTAKYTVSPSTKSPSTIDSFVVQKLTFVKEEPIEREAVFETTPVLIKTGIKIDLPIMADITGKIPDRNIHAVPDVNVETKIEMIDGLLEKIIEKTGEGIEREVPDIVHAITTIVRKLSKTEIMEIINKFFERSSSVPRITKKQEIILDIIPRIPTPEIGAIVKHLVTERIITGVSAAMTINMVTLTAPPSPIVIAEYTDMMKIEVVKRDLPVFKATVLGVGAITNKMINIHEKMAVDPTSISVVVKSVVKELKSLLRSEEKDIRPLAIKAMGNLGVPDILADLERIVKDKSEPKDIRTIAIYAMKKLTYKMPKVIRSILLPIYLRPEEPVECRIASLVIIMESRPKFGTLHIIGSSINDERNPQVASFTHSLLQNIARSKTPEITPMRSWIKKILSVVRPVISCPLFASNNGRYVTYFEKMEAGFGYEVSSIRSKTKLIPDMLVSKMYAHVFGQPFNMGEVGLRMEGVEKVIRKLIGTEGVLSDVLMGREDASSMLRPLSSPELGQTIVSELNDILSKIDMPDMSSIDAFKIGAYLRYLDNEYGFMVIDKESTESIITEAKRMYIDFIPRLVRGIEIDYLKTSVVPGDSYMIATPIGLPLSLNGTFLTIIKTKGRVALEGFNSIASLWNGSPLKVKVAIRPTVSYTSQISMSIVHDLFEVGTTVKKDIFVDLPINVETEVNINEKKVIINNRMPRSIKREIGVYSVPTLFTRIVPVGRSAYIPSEYKTHLPRHVEIVTSKDFSNAYNVDKEIRCPVLKTTVRVRADCDRIIPGMNDVTVSHLAKHIIEISMEPTSATPEKMIYEFKWGETESVVQRSSSSGSWFGAWFDSSEEVPEEVPVSEFLPITPKSIIENPIISKLKINVKTPTVTLMQKQVAIVYNPRMTIYQINYQTIVNEVAGARPIKVMVDTLVDVPMLVKLFMSVNERNIRVTDLVASIDIDMGTTSFREEKISLKVLPYHAEDDPEIPLEKGLRSFSDISIPTVNFKVIVEATEMTSRTISRIYDTQYSGYFVMYKPIMPEYVYITEPLSSIASARKSIVVIQILPSTGKVNSVVATPARTFYLLSWDLPHIVTSQVDIRTPITENIGTIVSPYSSALSRIPKDITTSFYRVCKVRPSHIRTIDNIALSWPDIDPSCEIVLAHDCSPQKLYTVISTPVTERGARKIKIIIPGHKIEVESGPVHVGVVLKINGEMKSINTAPLVRTITKSSGEIVTALKVVKKGERYIIKAPEVGLIVETNSRFIDIKMSPLLTSTLCGLCRHMPKTHAPISSSFDVIPSMMFKPYSIRSFIKPFLLSSPSCPASTEIVPRSAGTCSTVRRNIVINRPSSPTDVCFSVRPVEICSDFCHAKRSLSMSIGFHCLDPEDSFTKTLLRERHERILSELTNKIAHIQENVDIAQECGRI